MAERCDTSVLRSQEETEFNISLNKKIRHLRLVNGRDPYFLANKIGVSYRTYRRYECEGTRVSFYHLCKLAQLYNIDLNYFNCLDIQLSIYD